MILATNDLMTFYEYTTLLWHMTIVTVHSSLKQAQSLLYYQCFRHQVVHDLFKVMKREQTQKSNKIVCVFYRSKKKYVYLDEMRNTIKLILDSKLNFIICNISIKIVTYIHFVFPEKNLLSGKQAQIFMLMQSSCQSFAVLVQLDRVVLTVEV